jgi:hypothetical protein
MKKAFVLAVLLTAGAHWLVIDDSFQWSAQAQQRVPRSESVENAYEQRQSNVQVSGSGEVIKLLADDNKGSRHQRFILRMPSGRTLLISHNIDLAPRIASLQVGDQIDFFGEYEWNDKGGLLHWTHDDPRGRHVAGWLRHRGKVYQ